MYALFLGIGIGLVALVFLGRKDPEAIKRNLEAMKKKDLLETELEDSQPIYKVGEPTEEDRQQAKERQERFLSKMDPQSRTALRQYIEKKKEKYRTMTEDQIALKIATDDTKGIRYTIYAVAIGLLVFYLICALHFEEFNPTIIAKKLTLRHRMKLNPK